ncbi:MAG: hypothetical protein ACI9CE_000805 [Flavobacterium sp.]|jgi:hypothetical protein
MTSGISLADNEIDVLIHFTINADFFQQANRERVLDDKTLNVDQAWRDYW